jgi:para-nitrobenzyl esterase
VTEASFAEAYPNEEISNAGMVDSTIIRLPLLKIMSHKADQNGANVYAYVFTRQVGDYGSYHGAEIPFVFRNTQEESGLVDTVSSAWVSFARSGVPSAEGLEE